MRVWSGSIAATAVALLACLGLAAPAGAAGRTVPKGFFGVMADGPLTNGQVALGPELARMRRSGVETLRVVFDWDHAQPYATPADVPPGEAARFTLVNGVPTDFTRTDRIVAAATDYGIAVLPVVLHAPAWAVAGPRAYGSPPRQTATYAAFLDALVRRYGRSGTFWPGRPRVRPITAWQVWNEPNVPAEWAGRPWPSTYVGLLRAARDAIHAADPAATVVSAGVTNSGRASAWRALDLIYRAGGRGLFDVCALHPYAGDIGRVLHTVRNVRQVMRKRHRTTPIMLTEVTWSSGAGRTADGAYATWNTTERGQASRAARALRVLAHQRRRLGLLQVDWYTWLSPQVRRGPWFSYAGLNRLQDGRVVRKPALRAYARVALRLEGRRPRVRSRRP